jgi:hypothetical protein
LPRQADDELMLDETARTAATSRYL